VDNCDKLSLIEVRQHLAASAIRRSKVGSTSLAEMTILADAALEIAAKQSMI
jgi:hypothetical protein